MQIEFSSRVVPKELHIFETYHPGAVVSVQARNTGTWEVLWSCDKPEPSKGESRVFTPPLKVGKKNNINPVLLLIRPSCKAKQYYFHIQ